MKPLLFLSTCTSKEKLFVGLWILFAFALFLYSFTQIDLGLVISRYPFLYGIEKAFQYVGYFRRDISVALYLGIMGAGLLLFGATLLGVLKKQLSGKSMAVIIGCVSFILLFSYNAFSYDFFNYIFDAKILTHYHLNPYKYKALDFPADPMLGYMHWTHRTYPYGPMWLVLTVPLSFLGLNIFIVTFYLLKLLSVAAYLLFVWYFYQVVRIVQEKQALFLTVFLALNPLFVVEFLVSAHNDSSMFAFAFAAIYYLLKKNQVAAYLLLLLSIGVKFATVFLVPSFFVVSVMLFLKRTVPTRVFLSLSMSFMLIALILVSYRTIFEPWYLIYVIPFMLLLPWKKETGFVIWIISILSLLYYGPYLFFGQWTIAIIGIAFYNFQMSVFPITLFLLIIHCLLNLSYPLIMKKSYE